MTLTLTLPTETKDAAESVAEQLVAQWQELLPGKDFKKLVPSLVQDITNFVNTVNEGVPLLCSPHSALPLLPRALTACVPGS